MVWLVLRTAGIRPTGTLVANARFVELWEEADPELQSRVQAAQRRLEQILAPRG